MNEEYLWDKSGDLDPEIAELEGKLGQLRFKPAAHPLALPTVTPAPVWYRKRFFPVQAIAAAFIILVLAGGLWLGLRGSLFTDGKISQVAVSGPRPPIGPIDTTVAAAKPEAPQQDKSRSPAVHHAKFSNRVVAQQRRELIARRRSLDEARARRELQLAREGEAAKAQLIRALHITSDALNMVHRKIQGEREERRPIS